MKVYVVTFDDMDNWCIEKIFYREADAVAYCKANNSEAHFELYHYEEYEVE